MPGDNDEYEFAIEEFRARYQALMDLMGPPNRISARLPGEWRAYLDHEGGFRMTGWPTLDEIRDCVLAVETSWRQVKRAYGPSDRPDDPAGIPEPNIVRRAVMGSCHLRT